MNMRMTVTVMIRGMIVYALFMPALAAEWTESADFRETVTLGQVQGWVEENDIHRQNQEGRTILHEVIRRKPFNADLKVDIVQLLLDSGIDPNVQDELGMTALHWALYNNKLLSNHGDIILLLISSGADINVAAQDGRTPLHWALMDGNDFDIATWMIFAGGDLFREDQSGKIPSDYMTDAPAYYAKLKQLELSGGESSGELSEELSGRVHFGE